MADGKSLNTKNPEFLQILNFLLTFCTKNKILYEIKFKLLLVWKNIFEINFAGKFFKKIVTVLTKIKLLKFVYSRLSV
jgi:hypothetical protein